MATASYSAEQLRTLLEREDVIDAAAKALYGLDWDAKFPAWEQAPRQWREQNREAVRAQFAAILAITEAEAAERAKRCPHCGRTSHGFACAVLLQRDSGWEQR